MLSYADIMSPNKLFYFMSIKIVENENELNKDFNILKGVFQICPCMDFLLTLHFKCLGLGNSKNVFICFNTDF